MKLSDIKYVERFSDKLNANIDFRAKEAAIYEGLISTYSLSTTIISLKSVCPEIKVKRPKNEWGLDANECSLNIPVPFENLEKLMKRIDVCGWFISTVDFCAEKQVKSKLTSHCNFDSISAHLDDSITSLTLFLEAKFDMEVERKQLPEKMYHVTPEIFVSKIKQRGLIPKSASKLSHHPDRIYLCSDKEFTSDTLLKQLRAHSKRYASLNWAVLIIETSKLADSCRFFVDPNCQYTVYVLQNISPSAISNIEIR